MKNNRHINHKHRLIRLVKKEIFYDIDAITYKRADIGMTGASAQSQNAASSDSSENLDGSVLSRFADARDAELRSMLLFCLDDNRKSFADNVSSKEASTYEYSLVLPPEFEDNRLDMVTTKIHKYIVYGTLFDWFMTLGLNPQVSMAELDALGEEIVGLLRGKSWTKRPIQPFGPAGHIINR